MSHFFVEIAARGLITIQNKAPLKSFALKCSDVGSKELKVFLACCSKASLLSSFSIFPFFPARNEPSTPLVVRTEINS